MNNKKYNSEMSKQGKQYKNQGLIILAALMISLAIIFSGTFKEIPYDGVLRNETGYSIIENNTVPVTPYFKEVDNNGYQKVRPMETTNELINVKLLDNIGNATLSQNLSLNDGIAYFQAGHNISVGNTLTFYCENRIVQNNVELVNGNNITLSQLSDINCLTSDLVEVGYSNANIAGSLANPYEFCFETKGNISFHINKLVVNMRSDGAMDDGLFGDLPKLDYPVTYRVYDGYAKNLFPISRNGAARTRGAEVIYVDKAPSGEYAVSYTFTFGSSNNYGGTIVLDGNDNDKFCVLIRDDITGLNDYENVIIGHEAEI